MRYTLFLPIAAIFAVSAAPKPKRQGYLAPGAFDVLQVLPPAPVKGDARYGADRTIFRETRRMLTTPRGTLAINDVLSSPAAMMNDFSCAVGASLTPENAPLLKALMVRAGIDTSNQTNAAKRFYGRLRPFQIDPGPTCQDKSDLARSFDYPSGHTTWGWTWATILTELAPDRATPILARGRAYGDSRVVCGAHNQSAVEAGLISASATMAVVRAQPAFRADLAAARAELDGLRRDPAAARPAECAAEAALVAQRVP